MREREAENRSFPDFAYVRDTWIGRFKIIEFFCSLLAGALVPTTVHGHLSAFAFMSFVAWTTCINVIIDIVLHLVHVWNKFTFLTTYPEILLCLCTLGAFGFLVASITELAVAAYAKSPGLAQASGAFGFLCMTALAGECYFHFQNYREKQTQRRERQEKVNTGLEDAFADINNV